MIPWIVGGAVALIAVYFLAWQWGLLPREVMATGTVTMSDDKILKTRQFIRSSRLASHKSQTPGPLKREAVWEVQLPSGRWIDCDGEDCLGTAERAWK